MKIVGIVAEYNPFHNGHFFHLTETKQTLSPDLLVIIMSGAFTQRGRPALLNKWARTTMALEAGADLVIELPTIYATSSAENFAYGAMLLLQSIKASYFSCGVENPDPPLFAKAAQILSHETEETRQIMQKSLSEGNSYFRAKLCVLKKMLPDAVPLFNHPNNILGLTYMMAREKLGLAIDPFFILRQGRGYHDKSLYHYASATAIRRNLDWIDFDDYMPPFAAEILRQEVNLGRYCRETAFDQLLFTLLRLDKSELFTKLPEMEPGLDRYLVNKAFESRNYNEFLRAATSKRLTSNRINRIALRLLLEIDDKLFSESQNASAAPYLRILGIRKDKSKIIKDWRSNLSCPFIQKMDFPDSLCSFAKKSLEMDLRATDIHEANMIGPTEKRQDYVHPLIIL